MSSGAEPGTDYNSIADRIYIEGWALALTFAAVERWVSGERTAAIGCAIMSAVCQFVVIRWAAWIKAHPDNRLLRSFNSAATNAGWWIATLMVFMVYLALSSYMQGYLSETYKGPTANEIAVAVIKALPKQTVPAAPGATDILASPPRTKQAIKELLDETGRFEEITKTGFQLYIEWRDSIAMQNPEHICQNMESKPLQDKATALADKAGELQKALDAIYASNNLDRVEFGKALGAPLPLMSPQGLSSAEGALRAYAREIKLLGEHPACEDMINQDFAFKLLAMLRAFDQFGVWSANTSSKLTDYRENLRKELRSAP